MPLQIKNNRPVRIVIRRVPSDPTSLIAEIGAKYTILAKTVEYNAIDEEYNVDIIALCGTEISLQDLALFNPSWCELKFANGFECRTSDFVVNTVSTALLAQITMDFH